MNVIEHAIQDLRFAVRYFGRAPAAITTIVLLFALGIGVNTALFLLVRSFVSGPLPGVGRQDLLVRIRGIDRTVPGRAIGREFSYPEYREYAAQGALFRDVAAWTSTDVVLEIDAVGSGAESIDSGAATYVTANYFQVLGIRPILGAGLPLDVPDDGPPELAAVISHVLWERRFERSPDVIGRTMQVNGFTVTIVGVAPRRFAGARTGGSHMRVWLPLNARPQLQLAPPTLADYDDARYGLVARLQPGVPAEQADAIVQAIAARAAENATRGPSAAAASTDVVSLLGGNYFPPSGSGSDGSVAPYVALLFPPLLILLITCTNVSTLLTGLAVARRREIAVRLALGAARRRVVRQLVTESMLLAVAAGLVSLFVIRVCLRLFDAGIPDLEVEIDRYAGVFTFGLAVLAGLLFGVSPALHATRLPLSDALKDSAGTVIGTRLRLQAWLVVAQIAFTQPALLAMGALLLEMRTDLRALASQPIADRIVAVSFNTNPRYGSIDQEREETLRRVQERLAAAPGVAGVVPQEIADDYFEIASHPADRIDGTALQSPLPVRAIAAPAGYFPLMDMAFLRGRDFEPAERVGADAVVIGAAVARRLWGEADPLGRRLVTAGSNPRGERAFTVVGVVDESGGRGDSRIFTPQVRTTGHLLVRTHEPAEPLLSAIRAAAADAAPGHPVIAAQTLAAMQAAERRSIVNAIAAAGGMGGMALLLSAVGLYAVTAFAVRQRVREIGIRTALGAGSPQVVALFVRRGLRLGLIGMAIGLSLGIAGVRVLAALQGQTPPAGTAAVAVLVAAFVIGVAALASWIPARRAARIDPVEALRVE